MDKHTTNTVDAAGVVGFLTWMGAYLTAATNVLTVMIGIATLTWAIFRAWNEIGAWRKRRRELKQAEVL